MKFSTSIQKLLPFGYLFLVIMGILKESVYYYQLGINILKYSTLMDILISPIADLTAHPVVLVAVLLLFAFSYVVPTWLSRHSHKNWVRKITGLKPNGAELTEAEIEEHFTNVFIKCLAVCLMSFFLGIGIGEGYGVAKKINQGNLPYNYKIHYGPGLSEEACILGSNSAYYFLMRKGSKIIKITPVGTIESIELLNNKKLK